MPHFNRSSLGCHSNDSEPEPSILHTISTSTLPNWGLIVGGRSHTMDNQQKASNPKLLEAIITSGLNSTCIEGQVKKKAFYEQMLHKSGRTNRL